MKKQLIGLFMVGCLGLMSLSAKNAPTASKYTEFLKKEAARAEEIAQQQMLNAKRLAEQAVAHDKAIEELNQQKSVQIEAKGKMSNMSHVHTQTAKEFDRKAQMHQSQIDVIERKLAQQVHHLDTIKEQMPSTGMIQEMTP